MRRAPCFLAAFAAVIVSFVAPIGAQDPEAEKPERVPAKSIQSEVVRLQHAAAPEIVPILSQSLPSNVARRVRIIPDARTNAIVISADAADMKDVLALVAQLDVDVPKEKPAAAPARRSVAYEIALFMLTPGSEVSGKLPRTDAGVIDASDPAAVLAKLRQAIGQPGVIEVAKLSVMADDGKPWRWKSSVQVPMKNTNPGAPSFGGYQEATVELSINSETSRGAARRLGITGRVERFAESDKTAPDEPMFLPPPKLTSNIEFSASVEDGKLVMSAVESAASRFDAGYVLFVRVKP